MKLSKNPVDNNYFTFGKTQVIKDKLFCDYLTNSTGICGMYLFNGGSRCPKHRDKVSKKKSPSPKFRGKSKTYEGFQGAVE